MNLIAENHRAQLSRTHTQKNFNWISSNQEK